MKKILFLITLTFFFFKIVFAASITEELTQLNNLFNEGAITEEEFSKAKSILLKTETTTQTVEKKKKIIKKKKRKK